MSDQPDPGFGAPVVRTGGSHRPDAPLIVLLHGRGADENGMAGLAALLPADVAWAAVRGPIAEGAGYAWFANRGIGRPVAESLAATTAWFHRWLDTVAPLGRRVILVGFSGGAAFAGGLVLADPLRFAGAAILYGTLPFDAGVTTAAGRLTGLPVFVAQGEHDTVIPTDLLDATWRYLTGLSGAGATAHRDPAGHALSPTAARALATWLEAVAHRVAVDPTIEGQPA